METISKQAPEAQTYDGGVTPEQVEAWKQQHRKAFRIDIKDGEPIARMVIQKIEDIDFEE